MKLLFVVKNSAGKVHRNIGDDSISTSFAV